MIIGGAQESEGASATSGVQRPPRSRRAEPFVGVRRVSAGGDERLGPAIRHPVIVGVLAPRGVRAGMDAGGTRAAEGHGRRLIFRTRYRTDPISGFANNGDAPVDLARCSGNAWRGSSWLGLAPPTRISGGQTLAGSQPKVFNRAGPALCQAAFHARRSHTCIGAAHRARLARRDTAKAVKATAHQLARLIYALLTQGQDYVALLRIVWVK